MKRFSRSPDRGRRFELADRDRSPGRVRADMNQESQVVDAAGVVHVLSSHLPPNTAGG